MSQLLSRAEELVEMLCFDFYLSLQRTSGICSILEITMVIILIVIEIIMVIIISDKYKIMVIIIVTITVVVIVLIISLRKGIMVVGNNDNNLLANLTDGSTG